MIIFKRYKNRGRRLGKQRKLALARSVASSAFFNIIACGVDVATGKGFEIASQRKVQNSSWHHNVCPHIFRGKRPRGQIITRRFWNTRAAYVKVREHEKFNIIACGVDVATGKGFEIALHRVVQNSRWRHNVWAQKSQRSRWLSDMCLEQHIFSS